MNTNSQTSSVVHTLSHAAELFSLGNTVRAHEGALDNRVNISLEGWYGTITSLYENEQGEEYATVVSVSWLPPPPSPPTRTPASVLPFSPW